MEILTRWYVDGKATAKRWRRLVHPETQFTFETSGGANKLVRYLDLIGYGLPDTYGSGEVGKWIRDTRLAVTKRETWDVLTEVQQRGWLHLLEHNANDCLGRRKVVLIASAGLENTG